MPDDSPAKRRKPSVPRWRRFCQELVCQPSERRNPFRAAEDAGYRPSAAPGLLKQARVQEFLRELEMAAQGKAAATRAAEDLGTPVEVEVVSPSGLLVPDLDTALQETQGAIATRAEVLAMASRVVRAKVGDFFQAHRLPSGEKTAVANVEAVLEAPIAVIRQVGKDETGDLKLTFGDGQRAAQTLLDHYDRTREAEDPMARGRAVLNVLLFGGGSRADRDAVEALALRVEQLQEEQRKKLEGRE